MTSFKVGLALGSGSARGWAHIGVIKSLCNMGIHPDIISGCSIGALVGGAYAAGHLDDLETWVRTLRRKDVIGFFDLNLSSGGLIGGERLMNFFRVRVGDAIIELLPIFFAAVATDLNTGREIWLKSGSLLDAVRASISLPGIFAPVRIDDRWLVDGGLINPVPVSVCRAMGADLVIAVNLNGGLIGKHFSTGTPKNRGTPKVIGIDQEPGTLATRLKSSIKNSVDSMLSQVWRNDDNTPGLFDVVASSINIMQDRITRSRMAGDPPDIVITPRLEHLGLLEFYRAAEAIEEGMTSILQAEKTISQILNTGT
jgi:NTE family protein